MPSPQKGKSKKKGSDGKHKSKKKTVSKPSPQQEVLAPEPIMPELNVPDFDVNAAPAGSLMCEKHFGEYLLTSFEPRKRKLDPIETRQHIQFGRPLLVFFTQLYNDECTKISRAIQYLVEQPERKFTVICVSLDRSPKAFRKHVRSSQWPFVDYMLPISRALCIKYLIYGAPEIVICDSSGRTLNTAGLECLKIDSIGRDFPWKKPELKTALGSRFLFIDGTIVPLEHIEGMYLALQFVAGWDPSSLNFTQRLAYAVKGINCPKRQLVSVLCYVGGRHPEQYESFIDADCLQIIIPPEEDRISQLIQHFSIEVVPSLVLLDPNRQICNVNCAEWVFFDPTGAGFPWIPRIVQDLSSGDGYGVNEMPAVVLLLEDCTEEEQRQGAAALRHIASKYAEFAAMAGEHHLPYRFFYSLYWNSPENPDSQVRQLCGLGTTSGPMGLILDLPDKGTFYMVRHPDDPICNPSSSSNTEIQVQQNENSNSNVNEEETEKVDEENGINNGNDQEKHELENGNHEIETAPSFQTQIEQSIQNLIFRFESRELVPRMTNKNKIAIKC